MRANPLTPFGTLLAMAIVAAVMFAAIAYLEMEP